VGAREEFTRLKNLIEEVVKKIRFIGEVGLDKVFVPKSLDIQREVFISFLELARDYGLALNIHSVGTWREILNLLYKYDIKLAIFHWYSGPLNLLKEFKDRGYYITVNPAITIQQKTQRVIQEADLDILLTESDAPYDYRGMKLMPSLIPLSMDTVARIKGLSTDEVHEVIINNFKRLVKELNINNQVLNYLP